MHISTAPLGAEGVGLGIDGGAWSCDYSLHIRSAGINVKLNRFWTFFQDLCSDGGGKMVYCQFSCRFLTHMTVLCWLYQSLNKMFYKDGRTSGRRKKTRMAANWEDFLSPILKRISNISN